MKPSPITTRPKTCPECKQKFLRTRQIQPVCERFECMTAHAVKVAAKAKASRLKSESRKRKEAKRQSKEWIEANRSYGYLDKKAGDAVKSYVRMRDYGKPCISCNGSHKTTDSLRGHMTDGGHYRSVGSAKHVRFHLLNINGQCVSCNRDLSGNCVEYRKGMILKYGEDRVLKLEHDNEPRKYSKDDLRRMARIFRKRERLYKRLKGL